MKLILEHFRCFDKQTIIDFKKDNGVFLLNGPSGIGKSSIFKAIEFVLYGTVQKCTTYNRKKCKVELFFNGLHIVRTKTPNLLQVVYNEKTYIGTSAQEIINDRFGTYFHLTGIISQKSTKHFFSSSKEEKTIFLQSLLGDTTKIETWKAECKKRAKEYKERVTSSLSQIELVEEFLKKCEIQMEPIVEEECKPYLHTIDACIQENKQNIHTLQQTISDVQKKESILQEYTELVKKYKQQKDECTIIEEKIISILQCNPQDIKKSNTIKERINEYHTSYMQTQKNMTYKAQSKKLLTQLESFKHVQTIDTILRYKQLIPIVKRYKVSTVGDVEKEYHKISNYIQTYTEVLSQLKELQTKVHYLQQTHHNIHACPNCNISLLVDDSGLKRYTEENVLHIIQEHTEKINEIQKRGLKEKLSALVSEKHKLDGVFPLIKGEHSHTSQYMEECIQTKEKYDELTAEYKMILKQIKEQPREITDTNFVEHYSICTKYSNQLQEKERTEFQLVEMQKKLPSEYKGESVSTLTTKKDEMGKRLNYLMDIKEKIMEYKYAEKKYTEYLEYRTKCTEKHREYNEYKEKWHTVETFLSKILQTESETVESLCQQLNKEIESTISRFFPDNPISIQVVSSKVGEEGNRKFCIDIQCFDADANPITLDNLSGGEYDRCVLAFFLACNAYANTPIILLDECLSSLHSDAIEEIVQVIHEKCSTKFVCITLHQANLGLFDEVIQVDRL